MNALKVNIPGAKISYNYLYENMPIGDREEDLLFLRLSNGEAIDVGWYPACDPMGRFKITLSDCTQKQINSITVRELDQVIPAVESLSPFARSDCGEFNVPTALRPPFYYPTQWAPMQSRLQSALTTVIFQSS